MAEVSKDTAAQLRFEFYKSVLTFALATLGGEVTLLHSLFKDAPRRGFAYVSIVAITLACIFILGAKETLIKRLDPLPTRGRLDRVIDRIEFTSPTVERFLEQLSGGLYGIGLILFIIFVFQR